MEKFDHLFMLCGLLITLSFALPNATTPPVTPTTSGPSSHTTTGNLIESYTSNSNNSTQDTTGNTTPSNGNSGNSTIPSTQNSTNSTTANMQSNSSVPSPTGQTNITTEQITQTTTNITPTSLATQPASKPTITSMSTVSTRLNSPAVTLHGNNDSTTAEDLTTETTPGNKTNNETAAGAGLNFSEMSMTILFSVVLGVIVLMVLGQIVYKVSRNKHRMVQYSHRPLYNEDTGEQFVVPDDTLVISGGLYDGPQIYNPTVTTLNDEDQPTFAYTPTQLRLEFLREEQGTDRDYEATSFETFKTNE
ncbi:sialomucin core protein 24-like isoform X1 [Pygocentrus nattereri]|uniref:sialomucin core protein 24-like isoform X1 n=1 Tax=Pygocentrus nattereri TaxID=42514 RepID=UPI001891C834|nr:sialomucin core protein 24-like isoform X1 [Pygocentrus nattereri]